MKHGPTGSVMYAGDHYQRATSAGGGTNHRYMIYAGGRPVAQVNRAEGGGALGAPTFRYLHDDVLGSIDLVTTESGAIETSRYYTPFGERSGGLSSELPYGFTGHEEDADLGLVNMRGRIYDAQLGQFLSPDPIVQQPYGQGLNRFAYVMNSPLTLVDPSGLAWSGDTYQDVIATSISGPIMGAVGLGFEWNGDEAGTESMAFGSVLAGGAVAGSLLVGGGAAGGLGASAIAGGVGLPAIGAGMGAGVGLGGAATLGVAAEIGYRNYALGRVGDIGRVRTSTTGVVAGTGPVASDALIPGGPGTVQEVSSPVFAQDAGSTGTGATGQGNGGNDVPAPLVIEPSPDYQVYRDKDGNYRAFEILEAGVNPAKILRRLPKQLRTKARKIEGMIRAGGMRGISGRVTLKEAMDLGEAFVGRGFRIRMNGRMFESVDGKRSFRLPTRKVDRHLVSQEPFSTTGFVANFQHRPTGVGKWVNNVHLDVLPPY